VLDFYQERYKTEIEIKNVHSLRDLMYLFCFINKDSVCPIPPAAPKTATVYFASIGCCGCA